MKKNLLFKTLLLPLALLMSGCGVNTESSSSSIFSSSSSSFEGSSQAKFKLTVNSVNTEHGTVQVLKGSGRVNDETSVLATCESGYSFIGWYSDYELISSDLQYDFVMPSNDVTLTAVFASPASLRGDTPFLIPGTKTVVFGSYPQEFVEDEDIVAALGSMSGGHTEGTILEYGTDEDDVPERYLVSSVVKSRYAASGTKMNEGIGYFKFAPLYWRVLEKRGNKLTIFTEEVVDGVYWREIDSEDKHLINNYEFSDIRPFINNEFLNMAFTASQQEYINVTHVDNSIETTSVITDECICDDTNDKVYLLSYRDIVDNLLETNYIIGNTTDYARARNVEMSALKDSYGRAYWASRSPDAVHLFVSVVNPFGEVERYEYAYDYLSGVRPAMTITVS